MYLALARLLILLAALPKTDAFAHAHGTVVHRPFKVRGVSTVLGETADEKLARIMRNEQERLSAERKAPVPKSARKSPMEKLRIVFGKRKHVEPTASRALCVLPPDARWADDHSDGPAAPVVTLPPGFKPPTPRPLRPTGDLLTLLSAVLALLFRLCAGVLVSGWRPRLSFKAPPRGEYALKLPLLPLYLSDTSHVLRGEVSRPTGRLLLYEFDSSPFCRKVRDALTQLDLTVDIRPCPGAGHAPPNAFCDEHMALHKRMTVPFLVDEGQGVGMFESDRKSVV